MAHQASQPLPPPRAANKVEASPLCMKASEFMWPVRELCLAVAWRVFGSVSTEDTHLNTASGIFQNTGRPLSWESVSCIWDIWLCYLAEWGVVTVSGINVKSRIGLQNGGERESFNFIFLFMHCDFTPSSSVFFSFLFQHNTFRLLSEDFL